MNIANVLATCLENPCGAAPYSIASDPSFSPTFIVPESGEGLTRGCQRSRGVIEEGTKHLDLQPSLARREDDPDGVMIHWIAIPGVLDQILHLGKRTERKMKSASQSAMFVTQYCTSLNRKLTESHSIAECGLVSLTVSLEMPPCCQNSTDSQVKILSTVPKLDFPSLKILNVLPFKQFVIILGQCQMQFCYSITSKDNQTDFLI